MVYRVQKIKDYSPLPYRPLSEDLAELRTYKDCSIGWIHEHKGERRGQRETKEGIIPLYLLHRQSQIWQRQWRQMMPRKKTQVRECQCSFCRIHGARAASDPSGSLTFSETIPGALNRYRFGLRTADFLVCNGCGAYMGCILTTEDGAWGVVNLNTLRDRARFVQPPTRFDYDSEDTAGRIKRRKQKWTPASTTS